MIIVEIVETASEVEGYIHIFRKLVEHGVLSPRTGEGIERLVRLRNLAVHRYWVIDDAKIYREFRESEFKIVRSLLEKVRKYVGTRAQGEV